MDAQQKEPVKYVLGFAFNSTLNEVLLILKNKPPYLAGRYNGIGGHVEPGETPLEAMVREFAEETGIEQPTWNYYAKLFMPGVYDMPVYWTTCDISRAKTLTAEPVIVWDVHHLPVDMLASASWLIPMARSFIFHNEKSQGWRIEEIKATSEF